jgi:hypothetical protein
MKQRAAALAAVFAALAVLAACDNYNQSLKPEIEYNGSVEPAHSAAELQARINAIPPGGSGTVTVMESFPLGADIVIDGNRAVTVEAYSGTTTVAVLTRGANFDGSFFTVQSGALSLRGGREKGKLILDGGARDYSAPLVLVYGVLTLGDRATLRNNKDGAGVHVMGGSFAMTGGEISGNSGGGVQGGGGGGFTMTGGSITGNTVTSDGGGVYFNGVFTMTGGNISGNIAGNALGANTSGRGGGVYLGSGSSFIMTGGNITNNRSGSGGAGVSVSGSFTMEGGSISGNTSGGGSGGGGVQANVQVFTMTGGVISGNTTGSLSGGGGVYFVGSSFTMSGGEISGNTVTSADPGYGGGGVFFSGDTFTMEGGSISGNTVTNADLGSGGGGVSFGGDTFTMSGGVISGNTANTNGGGVYVGYGTFTKTGGIIYGDDDNNPDNGDATDNTVTSGNTNGHAAFCYDGGGGGYYRDATLDEDDDISTNDAMPSTSGQTVGYWTKQ